ncbi:cell wall metabolism sensor histidine kinase WalK [Alkalicoccus daliensis]|uniref:histidine kinase n=1 Tax=Alkalicoccus daliensis TaxID=745820 RepID=A0A1H0FQN5_9BACI|nr:cell wall metabolism sensor histidine kinase WalK [Alkalicoccus daliensis]SDN96947.1 PAS/PAC sensor signal transduction histidine kinase [Alkalicoccus daliensis]
MKKIRFYKSIHVKIVAIYVLLILIAMQVIGVYFTQQLEGQFETNFRETLNERAGLLAYNVEQELTADEEEEEQDLETRIDSLLRSDVFNMEFADVQVIDQNSIIVSATSPAQSGFVGQRTTLLSVKQALLGLDDREGEIRVNPVNNHRTLVMALPVESDNQEIVGAIYIQASMEATYDQMQEINQILIAGAVIALLLTAALGIFLSRTITRPIVDMKEQAVVMGQGDFSRYVHVYGDDEIGQLAETFNDLTDKLQEAHATTEGERRKLASVLMHMTDGVIATDRAGKVILVNRRAEEILDRKQEEMAGIDVTKILSLDKFMKLRDLYRFQDPLLLDFDNQEDEMVIEANFSTIAKDNGEENGIIAVLHDVTEQERVEEERREFVANVSHELRTPLTSMKSYLEALSDGALEDPEIAPQFLEVTANETDRMIRLVNDLLQLSKMDSKDYNVNTSEIDAPQFVNHVIDRFEMSTKNQEIQFKRRIPEDPIMVQGDRDKLTQLLDNIVSNAVKYSPEGGTINITLKVEQGRIVVSVKDEGVGIPKENIPHVFDRFYRVDKARSRNLGGTGLGLAIAKEIAMAHGGNIWVSSDWGKGTTFSFSLPYSQEVVAQQ